MRIIPGLLLLLLGAVASLFFWHYKGTLIPYPTLFLLASIAMCAGGMKLFFWALDTDSKELTSEINQTINELKATGDRIQVDLSLCEVRRNDYSEEREVNDDHTPGSISKYTAGWNAMTDSRQNIEVVNISQAVLIFKTTRSGKDVEFTSGILPYDRETLLLKMFAQKETTIYIDHDDPGRYYFDLEFLSPR